MYFKLKPSIYSDYGVTQDPRLPRGVSFKKGALITKQVPLPLVFPVNNTKEHPPNHFEGISIPVMSKLFLDTLLIAGIDSLVPYAVLLANRDAGLEWKEYFAVNILGLVSCADMNKSEYSELGLQVSGTPLVRFHRLVVDLSKARGLYLLRLAESPSIILIHERIVSVIRQRAPEGGWGISIVDLD